MFRRIHVAAEYRSAVESAVKIAANLKHQRMKLAPPPRPIMHVMLSSGESSKTKKRVRQVFREKEVKEVTTLPCHNYLRLSVKSWPIGSSRPNSSTLNSI